MTYLLNQYKVICKNSYHNFEIYHLNTLNHLVDGDITARDLQMLALISHRSEFTTPTILKEAHHMKFSALTNRLATLETKNLIRREKLHESSKTVVIKLTDAGKKIVEVYDHYTKKYIQYVKNALSLKEMYTLFTTFKKLKTLVYQNNDHDLENITFKKILTPLFLFDIYNYFVSFELEWLDYHENFIKHSDLFILSEIYIHLKDKNLNYKDLSNYLKIPYQSLMSKIRKFRTTKIMIQSELKDSFEDKMAVFLESYISLRTIVYYETLSHFSNKEQLIITKIFFLLKQHALNYLN
jgi:DNA-binding MarR family transcriptional regulator